MQIPSRLRRRLEPLPFPMRFSDGRIRVTTVRMALLRRWWALVPVGVLESSHALHAYQGGDVLDIGAFNGWYSVLLAPKANPGDRFVSFEPDPHALPMLRQMLRDLGRHFPSVELSVIPKPVGDGRRVAATWPAGHHPRFPAAEQANSVSSLIIDEFVSEYGLRPSLVKIDVEGGELAVLRGMRQTLAEHRPVLLLEIHPEWLQDGATASDAEAFVRDVGYDSSTLEDTPISSRQVCLPRVGAQATS